MNDWTEHNFLERLTPAARREPGTNSRACPDADILSGVAQGEASQWLCETVEEHLAKCSVCAGIYRRLLTFDQSNFALRESEWRETEKRLDNRMADFLRSRANAANPVPEQKSSRPLSRWDAPSKPFRWGRMQWALGLAAMFLLAASAYVLHHSSTTQTQTPLVARVSAPAQQTGGAGSAGNPIEKSATTELQRPGQESTKQTGQSEQPAPPSVKILTEKTTQPLPKAGRTPRGPAALVPSLTEPTSARENARPAAQSQVPQTSQAPPTIPASSPAKSGVASPDSNKTVPPSPHRDINPAPGARETLARSPQAESSSAIEQPRSVLPAAILLEAGTRLWIVLKSFRRQSDGNFQFEGTLLLPVKKGRTVILDRDAEISGRGLESGGHTSLLVSQMVVRGTHYLVEGKEAAIHAQTPGTGSALKFNSGQVLEMWLQSASIYKRVPAETGRPQSPQ
jgi:hypothetical protein